MAEISKFEADGVKYDLKDTTARRQATDLENRVKELEASNPAGVLQTTADKVAGFAEDPGSVKAYVDLIKKDAQDAHRRVDYLCGGFDDGEQNAIKNYIDVKVSEAGGGSGGGNVDQGEIDDLTARINTVDETVNDLADVFEAKSKIWDATASSFEKFLGDYADKMEAVDEALASVTKSVAEKVGKTSISLGIAPDGLIYVFVDGTPVGTGIPQGQSGDVFGYVDENNNIVLTGNLADGTYTVKYEMDNGTAVNVGNMVLDSNVYYSVKNTLTNCSNSNGTTTVVKGGSYSATISANSGYNLTSVKVTMGGTDITSSVYSNGKITISNVTGNIVITAVAESSGPKGNLADPTSSDWLTDTRLATKYGYGKANTGSILTNYIPVKRGDVLRVKGLNLFEKVNSQNSAIGCYTSTDKTADSTGKYNSYDELCVHTSISSETSTEGVKGDVSVSNNVYTYTILMRDGAQKGSSDIKYIRISAPLTDGYTAEDVIITVNEEIV